MTEKGTAIVTLSRAKSMSFLFRQFSVVIDDKKVGKIKSGEVKRFKVPAGRLSVRVAIDLYKSKPLSLDLRPNDSISLNCGDMAATSLRETFSFKGIEKSLNALISPGQHLYLREAAARDKGGKIERRQSPLKPREAVTPSRGNCSIVVSYRRDDSLHVTGRICDHLTNQFGQESVFRDLDSMPLGVDFRQHIEQTIEGCDVLLAIIGENWLDAKDRSGNRRLDNPDDYVRVEIESALKREIPVIPVLVKGAPIPEEDQLPENIRQLKYQAGIAIHEDYFQAGMQRLIKQLESKSLSGNATAPVKKQRFCINCGAEIASGFKFCIQCGRPG